MGWKHLGVRKGVSQHKKNLCSPWWNPHGCLYHLCRLYEVTAEGGLK
jgi:hypothetical protein